jgi:ATP synthase F0 subunit c
LGIKNLTYDMEKIKAIVVEDVSLELKGTLSIIRNDIPEIEVTGTAQTERDFWKLMKEGPEPDLVLLDLGLGGSTTVGVDICRRLNSDYPNVKVLIFTGVAFAAAIAVFGAAFGLGRIGQSAMESIARQPQAAADIRGSMILIGAFMEGVSLLAVIVCLLALYA